MQRQNTPIERTFEPVPLRHLPLTIDNCESKIPIRRTSLESYDQHVVFMRSCIQEILRRLRFVEQIWIENVEFVALDYFWRWVLAVVVDLVVLVPFEALFN